MASTQSPLMECLTQIARSLNLTQVVPYLMQHGHLSQYDTDDFKPYDKFNYNRNVLFIEYLNRNEMSEEILIAALEHSNQPKLAQLLRDAADRRKDPKKFENKGEIFKAEKAAYSEINVDSRQATTAPKFDVLSAVDDIIRKFNHLPKEKQKKLKIPIDDFLKSTFEDSRTELCQSLHVTDLANVYLSSVLPPSIILNIKAKFGGDATFDLFSAVANSNSLLVLMTFIVGLQKTKQEHLFHLFFTEAFFNKLFSILEEYDTD